MPNPATSVMNVVRPVLAWGFVPCFLLFLESPPAHSDCASYCQGDYWACIEASDASTCSTQHAICMQNCISTGEGADSFGAIAYSPSADAYGYSYGQQSQERAEDYAMSECRKAGGDSDCEIAIWFKNACGALAGDGRGAYGADWAETKSEAEAKAIDYCRQNTSEACDIRQAVCTD